ncbi:spore coat putative kinase YutH [Alkalihalobacterium chitinilyticum]|uniref:Spore coat protein YutH n=1 Tax=Alkalihalobacterium chitinilyticum TaxID=2980103 RepID=A0ABT5VIS7_9BACI|nr:spore coat protein YutH [Alkalihalobacterium chitinilyticum]MDE5415329.1 spore coat protein YutH [Alkalihalobacterium chitinilyticum]
MFERNIYDHYQLYCEERFMLGDLEGFEANREYYVFVPIEFTAGQSIQDMIVMTEHLKTTGERGVADIIRTVHNQAVALVDGVDGFLFKLPKSEAEWRAEAEESTGRSLAFFHYKGSNIQAAAQSTANYYGQWKFIWEKRLTQLEQWYQTMLQRLPQTEVDDAFLMSFPYYMGLTENAIQFVADSDIDEPYRGNEQPVICHNCFTDRSWLTSPNTAQSLIKLPSHFIIDHPSRDVAEWIRHEFHGEEFSETNLLKFIYDYESVKPLTSYSWRLIYARLLFPLKYFETLENYYGTQLKEERLYYGEKFFHLLDREQRNQTFLSDFHQLMANSEMITRVPRVDWLQQI